MSIFGNTFQTLEYALDFSSKRNKLISTNIANVDTPNYKRKDTSFNELLNEKLGQSFQAKQTHVKHIPFQNQSYTYKNFIQNNLQYNHNGNNVDMDKEMAQLAKNQIYYQSLVDRLNGKFHDIQTVIRGGR